VFSSLASWLKLGGGFILAALLLASGFQVASWRAGSIEATRLETEADTLKAQLSAIADRDKAAETARLEASAEIDRTQTELRAQIADLQERVKATVTTDPTCDLSEEAVGVLNRASGH
jgi:hypothetical protein